MWYLSNSHHIYPALIRKYFNHLERDFFPQTQHYLGNSSNNHSLHFCYEVIFFTWLYLQAAFITQGLGLWWLFWWADWWAWQEAIHWRKLGQCGESSMKGIMKLCWIKGNRIWVTTVWKHLQKEKKEEEHGNQSTVLFDVCCTALRLVALGVV